MTDKITHNKEVLKHKIFLKLASLMLAKQLDAEKSKERELQSTMGPNIPDDGHTSTNFNPYPITNKSSTYLND